jgi:hypothetical protein
LPFGVSRRYPFHPSRVSAGAIFPRELPSGPSGAELQLGLLVERRCNFVAQELKGTDIPAKEIWWKDHVHAAKEDGKPDVTKTEPPIKGEPPCDFARSLKELRNFQRNDAQQRIVLALALVAHRNSDHGRTPVTHETFGTCIEDGFAANDLRTSPIDQLVVESHRTVGVGQLPAFFPVGSLRSSYPVNILSHPYVCRMFQTFH